MHHDAQLILAVGVLLAAAVLAAGLASSLVLVSATFQGLTMHVLAQRVLRRPAPVARTDDPPRRGQPSAREMGPSRHGGYDRRPAI